MYVYIHLWMIYVYMLYTYVYPYTYLQLEWPHPSPNSAYNGSTTCGAALFPSGTVTEKGSAESALARGSMLPKR